MRLYLGWQPRHSFCKLSVAALIVGALLVLASHPSIEAQTGGCGPDPTGLQALGKGLAILSGKSPNAGGWCGGRSGNPGGSNVSRGQNTGLPGQQSGQNSGRPDQKAGQNSGPPSQKGEALDCDGLKAKLKHYCDAYHNKGDQSAGQTIDDISDKWARSRCGQGHGIGCPDLCKEPATKENPLPCGIGQTR